MARRITPSQFKSKMRQLEQKQRQAIHNYNHAVNNFNHEVKRAVNDYNSQVRKYNSNVRKNRQIINRELNKIRSSSSAQSSYSISIKVMQERYETVDRIYGEGVSVSPEQTRILDLIDNEQANSLITKRVIEDGSLPEEDTENEEIGNKLSLISSDLYNRWLGAVFALKPENPDATRHFCTSTRELFTELIEIKAPDEAVFKYNPNCKKTDNGNATRREKIKYMIRNINMDDSVASYIDEDINNIVELNHLLSGGTHGPAGKYSFDQLLQVKKRVEQGINFLCEISLTV